MFDPPGWAESIIHDSAPRLSAGWSHKLVEHP
jgi:hypothetical protein